MALLLTNDEEAISPKLLVVGRSIGNAKRVGQRCVRQIEKLRSEYQIDIARCVRPYMFGSISANHCLVMYVFNPSH